MSSGRFRRVVGLGVGVTFVGSALFAVGGSDTGSAQDRGRLTQNDPGNAPNAAVEPSRPGRQVEGTPVPLGIASEKPKGDGKTPDWFLKTDPASRAAAVAAAKAEVPSSEGPTLLEPVLTVEEKGRKLPAEVLGKQQGTGKSSVTAKEAKRAARLAAGDPVVLAGEPTVRTGVVKRSSPVLTSPGAGVASRAVPGSVSKVSGAGPALVLPAVAGGASKKPGGKPSRVLEGRGNAGKGAVLADSPAGLTAPVDGGQVVLADSDDPDGVVQLITATGEYVGLRPLSGKGKVKAVREGSSARWSGIMADGSDLVETPTASGVKGDIILSAAPKKDPVWDFELVVSDGLTPTMGDGQLVPSEFRPVGGSIRLRDTTGAVIAEIPAGVAVDAAGNESPLDLVLRQAKDNRWVVSVGADDAWLRAPGRVYPVRVDPSITRPVVSGSLRSLPEGGVSSAGSFPLMISDQYFGYGTQQAFAKFDFTGLGGSTQIQAAFLKVSIANCDAPYAWSPYAFDVKVASTTTPWDPATLSWASKPAVGPESTATPAWGTTLEYNITNDARWWANGNGTPGFQIRMDHWAAGGQPNYCYLSNVTIEVFPPGSFNTPPTGSMVAPASGATGVSITPQLQVAGADADGDTLVYAMRYCAPSFAVCQVAGNTGGGSTPTWSSSATWNPSGLAYSQGVEWEAWVWDGIASASTYIGRRSFTTVAAPNGVPVISGFTPAAAATVGAANGATVTVTVSMSATDPNTDPLQYSFEVMNNTGAVIVPSTPWQSLSTYSFSYPYGTTFYWQGRVRDVPATGTGTEVVMTVYPSATTILRTNAAPPTPTQTTPANGATNQPAQVALNATVVDPNGDPVLYRYYVCNSAGTNCPTTSPWVSGSWVTSTLTPNTQYSWRVEAKDNPPATAAPSGTSTMSGLWLFTVGAGAGSPVTAPVNPRPADGEQTTTRPYLEVNATDADGDAVEYAFQICAPDFPGAAASPQCFQSPWQASRFWLPPTDLNFGVTYKWRAWSRNTVDVNGAGLQSAWVNTLTASKPSLSSLGQLANGWAPNIDFDGSSDEAVNEALGSFTASAQDATIATVGPGVTVQRTYSDRIRKVGVFGRGWTSNLDVRLYRTTNNFAGVFSGNDPIVIVLPDGRREYFSQDQNGSYRPSQTGTFADVVKITAGVETGWWSYATPDRTKLLFNTAGLLARVEDRNGNKVNYVRNASGRLDQIVDAVSGRTLTIVYNAAGYVSSIATPTVAAHAGPLTWTYTYTGDFVTQVCPPSGGLAVGCTNYTYTSERLTKITKPKANTDVEVTYANSVFTLNAPNLLANGSFEDAADPSTTGWQYWNNTTGSVAVGSGPVVPVGGAPFGTKAVRMKYSAGADLEFIPPAVSVSGNTVYTASAMVQGATASRMSIYWFAYNGYGATVASGMAGDGVGESLWPTPQTGWMPIRGSFRTPENTTSVRVTFRWPPAQGNTGDTLIDGVMLEKGDGTRSRVATRKDGVGNITQYSYVLSGENTDVLTDDPRPAVGISTTSYNGKNQITKNVDSAGRITLFTYDTNGFQAKITDPLGRDTVSVNDDRGNVLQRTKLGRTEYFTYWPGTNLLKEVKDARSTSPTDNTYRTQYGYDTAGNLLSVTDPALAVQQWTITAGTEPAIGGGVNQFQPKGLIKTASDRTGLTTSYGYAVTGDKVRVIDPATGTLTIGYDEIGRITSQGRAASGTLPFAPTTYGYDVRSRIVRVTSPAITNTVTGASHQLQVETDRDANGNPITVRTKDLVVGGDATRTETMTYDLNDRLRTRTGPNSQVTTMTYDEVGNLVQTTDPRGLNVATTYDDRNLELTAKATNYADTVGGTARQVTLRTSQYDIAGRVALQTDAVNRATTYTYTGDDRVQQVTRTGTTSTTSTGPTTTTACSVVKNTGDTGWPGGYNQTIRVTNTGTQAWTGFTFVGPMPSGHTIDPNPVPPSGSLVMTNAGQQMSYTGAVAPGGIVNPIWFNVSVAGGSTATPASNYSCTGTLPASTTTVPPRDVTLAYFEYDAVGNVTLERRGSSAATGMSTVKREYSATNFLLKETLDQAVLNRVTTYTNDPAGRRTSETTGTFVRTYGYDVAKRLETVSTASGTATPFTTTNFYDGWGRKIRVRNPRGYDTDYTLDLADRVTKTQSPSMTVWSADGTTSATARPETSTGYNTFGETTHTKDERANTTTTSYDTSGRRTSRTYPADSGITPVESWNTYDNNGNVLQSTDRRGKITNYAYDMLNRLRTRTDPEPVPAGARPVTSWTINDASEVTSMTAPDGAVTNYTYDDLGRQRESTQIVRQDANAAYKTTTEYDDLSNVIRTTDPAGKTSTATYNAASQVVTATDAVGAVTQYTYKPTTGWLDTVVTANVRRVQHFYDTAGRRTRTDWTNVGGNTIFATEQWQYDANGNANQHTRPNFATDTTVYDELDRVKQSQNLMISPSTYALADAGYDAAGNLVRVVDPRNNITTNTYNNWNLLKQTVEPSTTAHPTAADRTWTVGYDAGGLPTSEVRAGVVSISRTYDGLGRLTAESGSGGGATAAAKSFAYDAASRMTTAGAQIFTYDDRGLLKTSTGTSGTSSFAYDSIGRIASRTDAAGTITFGWTDRSELKQVTTSTWSGAYTWKPEGDLDKITYNSGATRTFAYDGMGRLIDDQLKNPAATEIARRQYTYNNDSSIATRTITQAGNTAAGTNSYTYDAGSRLTGLTGPGASTYTYDLAGNRLTAGATTFTYDARNRLMTGGGATYNWTARGTLASTTGTAAATYAYDALDRLTSAGGVTYTYDALDRVLTRNGTAGFAYAGTETDPVADGTSTYQRSPGGALLGITKTGVTGIAGMDRHGDMTWTLNPTTGAINDTVVNDPFGKFLASTGTKPAIGFQGDWTDPTTNLVWMAARWYNPTTGTFLSRDTYAGDIGAYATLNRYTYGLNNTLRYFDPTGRAACGDYYCEDWTLNTDPKTVSEIYSYQVADQEKVWLRGLIDIAKSWVTFGKNWGLVTEIREAYANAYVLQNDGRVTTDGVAALEMTRLRPDNVASIAISLLTRPSRMLNQSLSDGGWFYTNPGNFVFTRGVHGIFSAVGWGQANRGGEKFRHFGNTVTFDRSSRTVNLDSYTDFATSTLDSLAGCISLTIGQCHPDGGANKLWDKNLARAGWGNSAAVDRQIAQSDMRFSAYAASGYALAGIYNDADTARQQAKTFNQPGRSATNVRRSVPDPKPVVRPSGAPNRDSPWYVSYRDADGTIKTVGNANGMHAEEIIQQTNPGTPMSRPFGWRTVDDSKGREWVPGTVCVKCQVYPPELFAPGTKGAPGGAWEVKKP